MRSTLEWAQVRSMAADGVSQREIVKRLGINRRTVRRMLESDVQPRYQRGATGSMFDPLKPSPERGVVAVADALVAGSRREPLAARLGRRPSAPVALGVSGELAFPLDRTDRPGRWLAAACLSR